jgi:hypothetical protein
MSICGDGLEQWEAGVGGESTRSGLSRNRKILLFFFAPQRAHIICRFQFSASRKKRDLLNISIRLICFLSLLMLNCSVGIVLPTIEVRFENLKADADVHIGTRGLPTILNSVTNIFEVQYPPPPPTTLGCRVWTSYFCKIHMVWDFCFVSWSGSCECSAHIAKQEADDANSQWYQWYHQA